jgi:excisionase family DNA binding protein
VTEVTFALPDAVLEQIAQRVAEIMAERSCTLPTRWLSVAQAADLLAVDPKTIRAAIRDGRLPAAHLGRVQRIQESDLQQLLDAAGVPARRGPSRLRAVAPAGEFTKRAKGV